MENFLQNSQPLNLWKNPMTIVVSWISDERDFPTLWTVADTRLTRERSMLGDKAPLFECGAKLFSLKIICSEPNEKHIFDKIYFTTTIGMAFAGSSLLALNLYAFLCYTLGNLASPNQAIPSIHTIAEHINAAFQSMIENFIDINTSSAPCEISIFGYCPVTNQHRFFHIRHEGNDKTIFFNEFIFTDENSIHLMGSNKDEIRELILNKRKDLTGRNYWRSPKGAIEEIIKNQTYIEIGGELQLGISYPLGFKLTPIYAPDPMGKYLSHTNPKLFHQGVNLYTNSSLTNLDGCFIHTDSILKEEWTI